MSSTNVHSNGIHICAGQAIPTEKGMDVPPKSAKRGLKIIEVKEGPNAEIPVYDNIVAKDDKKIIGRATNNGQILSGNANEVKEALGKADIEK